MRNELVLQRPLKTIAALAQRLELLPFDIVSGEAGRLVYPKIQVNLSPLRMFSDLTVGQPGESYRLEGYQKRGADEDPVDLGNGLSFVYLAPEFGREADYWLDVHFPSGMIGHGRPLMHCRLINIPVGQIFETGV